MTRKRQLLVVEDEEAIRSGLVDVFVFHGFAVDATGDGQDGLQRALSGNYDLVLLDVMLPSLDGFEVCERIRARDRRQPIIMLTAKTADDDIVTGLRLGADDYISKPFGVQELVLRVEAVLRRVLGDANTPSNIRLEDGCTVNCDNLEAERDGETIALTSRETELLQYLAAHAERAVTRDELLAEVWGYARHLDIETRTVDIHIAKLRRKLERDPSAPANLVTVRGRGYRLRVAAP